MIFLIIIFNIICIYDLKGVVMIEATKNLYSKIGLLITQGELSLDVNETMVFKDMYSVYRNHYNFNEPSNTELRRLGIYLNTHKNEIDAAQYKRHIMLQYKKTKDLDLAKYVVKIIDQYNLGDNQIEIV